MRILHLHENEELRGGSEIYIRALISFLREYGCDSELYIPKAKDAAEFDLPALTVATCEIKKLQPDLIHIHGLNAPKLIRWCLDRWPVVRSMHEPRMVCPGHGKFWMRSKCHCNAVFGWHCLYHAYTEKCVGTRQPLSVIRALRNTQFEVQHAAKRYRTIVVMSKFMKALAMEGGIPKNRITTIPYFTQPLENYCQIQSDRKACLFVGRLSPTKGADLLLEAALPLLAKYPDFDLDIVGSGPMEAELQSRCKAYISGGRIHFHGWKNSEEIADLMQSAYMIAFPSIYPEAFGIVGIEAMMHSRPVVAFDTGGVSEWLANGKTGIMVDLQNVQAYRNAIESLIRDGKLHARMSRKSYEVAINRFTPQLHVSRLLEIYQNAISQGSTPH